MTTRKWTFFVFICIGVEYLGTFCSVLFGFRKCNKKNDIAPSSQDTWNQCYKYHRHIVFPFLKHKHHKIDASFGSSKVSLWRWDLKMSEFHSPCNWYSTAIGLVCVRGEGLTDRSIAVICGIIFLTWDVWLLETQIRAYVFEEWPK